MKYVLNGIAFILLAAFGLLAVGVLVGGPVWGISEEFHLSLVQAFGTYLLFAALAGVLVAALVWASMRLGL